MAGPPVDIKAGAGGVRIEGLAKLRRSLREIDKTLDVQLRNELKEAAGPIRAEAARRAPRGTGPIPASRKPKKRLADSLTISARAGGVAIRSNLPYAAVVHGRAVGGTVRPGRRPFDTRNRADWRAVAPRPFITEAIKGREKQVLAAAGDAIEKAAARAGWR